MRWVILAVLASATVALGQTDFGAPQERHLKLDWQAGERRGRPVVYGRVFNDHGFGARDIRLLVEGLDGAGNVISRTVGHVPFLITPGTTSSFEVPVPFPASRYRVSVVSVRWVLPDDDPLFRRF